MLNFYKKKRKKKKQGHTHDISRYEAEKLTDRWSDIMSPFSATETSILPNHSNSTTQLTNGRTCTGTNFMFRTHPTSLYMKVLPGNREVRHRHVCVDILSVSEL